MVIAIALPVLSYRQAKKGPYSFLQLILNGQKSLLLHSLEIVAYILNFIFKFTFILFESLLNGAMTTASS